MSEDLSGLEVMEFTNSEEERKEIGFYQMHVQQIYKDQ